MDSIQKIALLAILITVTFWIGQRSGEQPATAPKHDITHFEAEIKQPEKTKPQPKPKQNLEKHFGNELPVIKQAAARNNCRGELFTVLLAIRKAENGRAGREFGVLHPRAVNTNLDTQAGWAAATVVKNYKRWQDAGSKGDYITFLGNRYCPPDAHPLNKNWQNNVRKWVDILQN